MIPYPVLNKFADQAQTDVEVAQQDVVLTYALQRLHQHGLLRLLVFKGGTYLRKMIVGGLGRISEDLDFTQNGIQKDPEALFRKAFAQPFDGITFTIDNAHTTDEGSWACDVHYTHEHAEDHFSIDVSYREAPFLNPRPTPQIPQSYFPSLPFTPVDVPSLPMVEAISEKLRALQQRTSDRDYYDVIQYASLPFKADPARFLAAAKLWSVRQSLDPPLILKKLGTGLKDWKNLNRLLGKNQQKDWNPECAKAAKRFSFLNNLTDLEKRLAKDARPQKMRAEVLKQAAAFEP